MISNKLVTARLMEWKTSTYTNCTLFVLETPFSLNSTEMSSIRRRCLYFQTYLTPLDTPFSFIFSNVTVSSCKLLTVPYRKRERAVSYQTSPIVPLTIYFSGETDSARQLVISYPSKREGWVQPITTVCCFLRKRGMKGGLLPTSTLINRNALESLNSTVARYQAWTSCL